MFPNKFPSFCSNKSCSKRLDAGEGYVQKVEGKYVSWCKDCVPIRIGAPSVVASINDSFEISIPYDVNAVALIKSLPKSKWNPDKKCWTVSDAMSDRSRVLEVLDALKIQVPQSIRVSTEESIDKDLSKDIQLSSMYPFQKEGSIFCASKQKCLLGDEMGLGKSVQALMSIPKNVPIMVVCRAGIKFNWADEASKWRPDLKVSVVSGKDGFYWPDNSEIVIVNHDILPKHFNTPAKIAGETKQRHLDRLRIFRRELVAMNPQASSTYLIVDEAHDFKNYTSQRSKKLKEMCKMVKKVIGLTGSPLTNRPPELYGVFDVLGIASDTFGSFDNFKKLFNAIDEVVNRDGQRRIVWGMPKPIVPELLKRSMLRRLRSKVLPDLPQKTYTTIVTDLNDASLKKQMDGLLEDWEDLIHEGELPPFSCFSEVRKDLAKSRIPQMVEFVEDAEDQGVPLVVFSAHLSPLDALLTRPGWAVISGDTPPEMRQSIVRMFQQNKLKGVGVSIRAGGVGITLTNAWKALFVDLDWSPASNWQAEDRIARIGQKSNKVEIVRMVSNHPLDVHINKLLSHKVKVIQESIDSNIEVEVAKQETEEEFQNRMARLSSEQEKRRLESISLRVRTIHKRESTKVNISDTSFCLSKADTIRRAFKHMLSVCDGAVQRDCVGFNKPDSVSAHWVLSSGLSEDYELETAFLMLSRYRRQLEKTFPGLFEILTIETHHEKEIA
jgi:SWI/SNF-related matrix-associated actin-dependent regulator 1 of chromatin subfamily A